MNFEAASLPPGCLSDLKLDASFAGEARAVREVEAHIARCTECRARHAELAAERQAFLAQRPEFEVPQKSRRARTRVAVLSGFAVAAAALLWAAPHVQPDVPGVRLKGGPRLDYYVQREAAASRGTTLTKLAPGDRVRFSYTSERSAYLAVYGLDARGQASVFYPAAQGAARVEPGADQLLETAVELDDALGSEQVFAVFCDAPFLVEPLRLALFAQRTLEARSGCRIDKLGWTKESTP